MRTKDLISLENITSKEISEIMKLAAKCKKDPLGKKKVLRDKTIALLFQKPSNRTRISFEVAAVHLGAYVMYLSPREIDMGKREPVKDVGRVISRYVDGMVARVFSHKDVEALAAYSDVPVINGLSDMSHPCQALSDLFTMMEMKKGPRGLTLSWVGDGNNVLNSLMYVCAKSGVNVRISTPKGYEPREDIYEKARAIASKNGSYVDFFASPGECVRESDFVYADVWVSMGDESEKEQRLKDFDGFQVNEQLMKKARPDTLIMHCLPAHRGEEVSDIIDGKNSIIYDQAENRMHAQKAVLLKLMKR